jgi:hypothetical protein
VSYRADLLAPKLLEAISAIEPSSWLIFAVALILVTLAGAIATLAWVDLRQLHAWSQSLLPTPGVLAALAIGWLAFGLSLWVMLAEPVGAPWFYVVGTVCLAHAIGFLTPFAPAGLGVREAVIAVCLTPYLQFDEAIFLATINRALFFALEFFLFSIGLLQRPSKSRSA